MIGVSRFIAIIDSDRDVRRAIRRLLRAHGFRAQGFASAEAFLARGRRDEPACLVLDVELDMSGIDLLHRLKADGSSLPVVIMTAADDIGGPIVEPSWSDTRSVTHFSRPSSRWLRSDGQQKKGAID